MDFYVKVVREARPAQTPSKCNHKWPGGPFRNFSVGKSGQEDPLEWLGGEKWPGGPFRVVRKSGQEDPLEWLGGGK